MFAFAITFVFVCGFITAAITDPDSELHSHSITINSGTPSLLAHLISDQIKEHGFLFINNTYIGQDIAINSTDNSIKGLTSLSQLVSNVTEYYDSFVQASNFEYTLGNVAGRKEIAKGWNKVSGAPKQVLVTAHSEASYLTHSPLYLIFACPGLPDLDKGGHTIVYSIDKIVNKLKSTKLGRNLLDQVAKYGVTYIRNDPSVHNKRYKPIWDGVNYPQWEHRFSGSSKDDIIAMLTKNGQSVKWVQYKDDNGDMSETLHTEWTMPGFRLHPITNNIVWFNQLYAMNGRYFNAHNVTGMDGVPLKERPLHSLIGNGREITDEEYELLDSIHNEIAVLIPWDHLGDILAIDNWKYQHGRMPYDSSRNCVINWGRAVTGGEYIYDPMHFSPQETVNSVKNDINAIYKLLDEFKWYHTIYQHVSYRLSANEIIVATNFDEFSFENTNNLPPVYKEILDYRKDINVIIHVNNPDIASVALSEHNFLPIDQSYYMLYPVTHLFNQQDVNITEILGDESRLLLIRNGGMIVLGSLIEEAFTRLFYAIRAAQSQVLSLSIHQSIDDVIFPSKEIQEVTIHQALNFNIDGYGHLEFKAWKRRYNLYNMDIDHDLNNFDESVEYFDSTQVDLRKDVVKAYHALDKLGWVESIYQHITATLPNNDNIMLINAYGLEFGEVTIENLMEVAMNGSVIYEGNSVRKGFINPSGLTLHAAVHEARDDAKIVIHCHNDALSAISVLKQGLSMDFINNEYRQLIGKIVYHDFDSLSLAMNKTALANILQDGSNVIILRNHGILTIGETVELAFNRLYYTIQACQTQIKSMAQSKLISEQQRQRTENNQKCDSSVSYYSAWKRFSI